MRKIFGLALVVSFMLAACEEDRTILSESNYHVKFDLNNTSLTEGNSTVTIPVRLVATASAAPVEIQYTVTGTAVEGTDFEFVSTKGSATIAAGAFATNVVIKLLDDVNSDGAKTIILTLTSVSGGFRTGDGLPGKVLTLTIADNDCAFDVTSWSGNFVANEIYASSTYGPYEVTFQQDASNPNRFRFDNFYDSGCDAYLVFDPATVTVRFPDQAPCGSPLTASSGTFNQCEGSITISLHFDGQTWTYSFKKA